MRSFSVLNELQLFIGALFIKLEGLMLVAVASRFGSLRRFPLGTITRRQREKGKLTSLIWILGTQARQYEEKQNFDSFGRPKSSFFMTHSTKWTLSFSLVTTRC